MLLLDRREVPPDSRAAIEAAAAVFAAARQRHISDADPLARTWLRACMKVAGVRRLDRPSDIRKVERVGLASAHVAARLADRRAGPAAPSQIRAPGVRPVAL